MNNQVGAIVSSILLSAFIIVLGFALNRKIGCLTALLCGLLVIGLILWSAS